MKLSQSLPTVASRPDDWVNTLAGLHSSSPEPRSNLIYSQWRTPSVVASTMGCILFALIGSIHVFQFFRHRCWYLYPIVLAVFVTFISFLTRVVFSFYPQNFAAHMTSNISLTLTPSLVIVSCYMTFDRIVDWITPTSKRTITTLWLHSRWLGPLLNVVMFFACSVQLLGTGTATMAHMQNIDAATSQQWSRQGFKILQIGIDIQLACLGLFWIALLRYLVISRKWASNTFDFDGRQWRRLVWCMALVVCFITLQTIFQLVETVTFTSKDNYLFEHEWTFWLCTAFPLLSGFILLSFIHPGQYLPSDFQQPCNNEGRKSKHKRIQGSIGSLSPQPPHLNEVPQV